MRSRSTSASACGPVIDGPRAATLRLVEGVYFLADDAVLEWAVAMLASLRRHEPSLPVTWVPFGGADRRLRRFCDAYQVQTWQDLASLDAWDVLGRSAYPQNPTGARLFRKLAIFEGDYSRFLYIDADVLVRMPLRWALDSLALSQCGACFYDEGLEDVYLDPELRRRMVELYGARGWNTGFWAARREAICYETTQRLLSDALLVCKGFAATGEQPFLNFVLDKAQVATGSLREHAPLPNLPRSLLASNISRRSLRLVPAVHWAGQGRPSLGMPNFSIWFTSRVRARRPSSLARLTALLLARSLWRRARRLLGRPTS